MVTFVFESDRLRMKCPLIAVKNLVKIRTPLKLILEVYSLHNAFVSGIQQCGEIPQRTVAHRVSVERI